MLHWITGSLRHSIEAEVRQHRRRNLALRRERYPVTTKLLRRIFSIESAAIWFGIYVGLAAASIALDWVNTTICRQIACPFAMPYLYSDTPRHAATLFGIAGYLITAQAGALAVLSIAVGLVTLIGQSGNADADVSLYYNESLTVPLVASSVTLLLVLCMQVVWPLHKFASLMRVSGGTLVAQTDLTLLHIVWFCLNMAAFARFAIVSLSFGDVSSRSFHRRRYTANQLVPEALRQQLMSAYFNVMGRSLDGGTTSNEPTVWFTGMSTLTSHPEVTTDLGTGKVLHDVWTRPLRLALNNWIRRSRKEHRQGAQHDLISFLVRFGIPYSGQTTLVRGRCKTHLTKWEGFLIRISLRFRLV